MPSFPAPPPPDPAIDVAETTTTETVTIDVADPRIPAVADLFTVRQRTIIYLLSVMLGAAYPIVSGQVDLHWGFLAGYASWNTLVGLIAVSNTPVRDGPLAD